MKALNVCQAEKRGSEPRYLSPNRMEAIAYGVQARFEENTGYEKMVTDATINIARALGVSEHEIESWASHRLTRLAHKTEKLQEIKGLLEKVYSNTLNA